MSATKPAVRSGGQIEQAALLDLVLAVWRRLRPRSHARTRPLAILSDHLLADAGLNGPRYEQPTWERFIHRQ
jgi:hypothetical protein